MPAVASVGAAGVARGSSTSRLQAVAETTGGQYYKAERADQLEKALGDLPNHVTVVKKHVDTASWFAGVGACSS